MTLVIGKTQSITKKTDSHNQLDMLHIIGM